MNINEFKKKISNYNIEKERYSIYEGKKSDSFVLEEYYGVYKIMYCDEKGDLNEIKSFIDENQAIQFLFQLVVENY